MRKSFSRLANQFGESANLTLFYDTESKWQAIGLQTQVCGFESCQCLMNTQKDKNIKSRELIEKTLFNSYNLNDEPELSKSEAQQRRIHRRSESKQKTLQRRAERSRGRIRW